ncbi:MAG: hypothetical protein BGN91_01565 [Nitrobacter sp. 62-13]|jgi:hypothetical protein|uniref:DUF3016 domain-containing protein n=1 Tax=Nitrobacter sp. 62-13 TaxID=1895797 RepID=UPI00095EF621|nr:DUF3016 domain-containing protein [Nitrobacter sp. 62-13]OJU26468.1 MAG: hypothetical protein BGN91_01565 [Nitrobacter sp. 62-13]
MIRDRFPAAALIVLLLAPGTSFASVKVRFVNPERYTDAGAFDAGGRAATLAAFRAHLERLGARLLTPRQDLTIKILNVDLAGENEPWRLSDVRIMRDVTPPRITLSYVLAEKGKPTHSGEETLTDINYQMNPSARLSSDRYAYEKALLDGWFRRVVGRQRP